MNNKGTSVPAPGPAKLGGGRRAEEANEDKEEEEEEEGRGREEERTLVQEPWPTLRFQKTGSTLTWALADTREAPGAPRPTTARPLLPPKLGRGQH